MAHVLSSGCESSRAIQRHRTSDNPNGLLRVVGRIESSEAKSNRRVHFIFRQSNRVQHMRWKQRSGRAGRTCRSRQLRLHYRKQMSAIARSEKNVGVSKAQQRIEEVEADSRQMVQMAGVGLLVEMVAHELARATESALASLEGLRGQNLPHEVKVRLDTLRAEIKSVSKRLRVLDEASVPGRQRAEAFDLVRLVEDLKEGHDAQFKRHKIEMRIRGAKGPLRVKLVKGMVVQILENLLANSVYWMKIRADREASYRPVIDVRIELDPLTIRFSDNGRGIAPDHRERVFRAYWSLKEVSKRRGLGLFIASSNAEDLKGRLTLSDKPDKQTGRLHEFVLELPDAAVIR